MTCGTIAFTNYTGSRAANFHAMTREGGILLRVAGGGIGSASIRTAEYGRDALTRDELGLRPG